MKQHQISVARKEHAGDLYRFFFRTDWMEPKEAHVVLEALKQFFTAPGFKIHVNEREATLRQIDIT